MVELSFFAQESWLWDRAGLDTNFSSLKSVYLDPKSNVRVEYV